MLYELRHYYTVSTTDLGTVVRFSGEQFVPGLQQAGIAVIGCFTTSLGITPRFTTLTAFEDANDRQTKLAAFYGSTTWREMAAGLTVNGRDIVQGYDSALLIPTSYSPDVMSFLNAPTTGVFEERIYHGTSILNHAKINQRFATHTQRLFEKHGVNTVGYWDVEIGANQPALYYLVRYDSLADHDAPWNRFRSDPEWGAAVAESEKDGPIVRAIEASILAPTAFSPLH